MEAEDQRESYLKDNPIAPGQKQQGTHALSGST